MRNKTFIIIAAGLLVSCTSKKEEQKNTEEVVSDVVTLTVAQIKNSGIEAAHLPARLL